MPNKLSLAGSIGLKRRRRSALAVLILAAAAAQAGAADTGKYYLHDAELLKNLQAASEEMTPASEEKISEALLRNLEAGVARQSAVTSKTQRTAFEGRVGVLQRLSWRRIQACGLYSDCAPTMLDTCDMKLPERPDGASMADRVLRITDDIKAVTSAIARFSVLIAADPDGAKSVPDIPEVDVKDALADLTEASAAITREVKERGAAPSATVARLSESADALLTKASTAVIAARTGDTDEGKRLSRLLDILHKAKDPGLIVDQQARQLLVKASATPLPDEMKDALAKYTQAQAETVGDLVKWLATEDASITKIRLEMVADLRKIAVAKRNAELAEKRAALNILKKKLALSSAQLTLERELRKPAYDDNAVYGGCAYDGLLALHAQLRLSSASAKPDVRKIVGDRNSVYDYMTYLSHYMERIGYLAEQQVLLDQEMLAQEHRNSILRSQAASRARASLTRQGLDGLIAFAEGGVSYDDVNGIVQLIQTALLGVIAKK